MRYDAVVVGAGPNGLAAAITLARAGRSVLVVEANPTVGGGARTAELTLPGFQHDVCSAIHPMGLGSPFLRGLPLEAHGLQWIHPGAPLAHPFDDGTAALLERDPRAMAATLGVDAAAWERLMTPLAAAWSELLLQPAGWRDVLRHLPTMAGFGLRALCSARGLGRAALRGERARALLAGLCAHAAVPLDRPGSAAVGLVLGLLGHAVGWPLPRGGSQRIADAMAAYLRALGGEIETDHRVRSLRELPPSRIVMLDLTPRQILAVGGDALPARWARRLARFRYGPGVFKLDWALDGPVPWRAPGCARAATVHLGGTVAEMAASERDAWEGRHAERPYTLLAQPTLFDASRAPAGRHVAWAYCHVPHGSTRDMTQTIERQVERFAPGFRERILARHAMNCVAMERYDANYVGGDIAGGANDLLQLVARLPWWTPVPGLYVCSSSTPPGPGVHGLSGWLAALCALRGA